MRIIKESKIDDAVSSAVDFYFDYLNNGYSKSGAFDQAIEDIGESGVSVSEITKIEKLLKAELKNK